MGVHKAGEPGPEGTCERSVQADETPPSLQMADQPPLSFEEAVSKYRDSLVRYIHIMLGTRLASYDLVEELIQDALCRVWIRGRAQFAALRSEPQQRAYLYTTASHVTVTYLQQRRSRRGRVEPWSSYIARQISSSSETAATMNEDAHLTAVIATHGTGWWYAGAARLGDEPAEIVLVREHIQDVFASLTDDHRAILILLGQGFELAEAARCLGISPNVAKQRTYRARQTLYRRNLR